MADAYLPFTKLPPAAPSLPSAKEVGQLLKDVVGQSTAGIGSASIRLAGIGLQLPALAVAGRTAEEAELGEMLMKAGLAKVMPTLLRAGDLPRQVAGVVLLQVCRPSALGGKNRTRKLAATPALEALGELIARHGLNAAAPRRASQAAVWTGSNRGDDPSFWGSLQPKSEFLFHACQIISKMVSRSPECHPRMLAPKGPASVMHEILIKDNLPIPVISCAVNYFYNLTRNSPSRPAVLRLGVLDLLIQIAKLGQIERRSFGAAMAVANLASGAEENKELAEATPDVLNQVLDALRAALKKERYQGSKWRLEELLQGLNSLASNDVNQERLCDSGAIEMVLDTLDALGELTEEHGQKSHVYLSWSHGTAVLYQLAFSESVARRIKANARAMDFLTGLSDSGIASAARKNANGTLFLLDDLDGQGNRRDNAQAAESEGHIMLSYNWNEQDIVLRISDELKRRGYKVWLDLDQMSGSTLEAMAGAVEGASVVCVCSSDAYKNSPNCRLEAEYAFTRKVHVIPILVQDGYRAAGWLGALLGSKLWYDVTNKAQWTSALTNLCRDLDKTVSSSGQAQGSGGAAAPARPSGRPAVEKWSAVDVGEWLTSESLAPVVSKFTKNGISGLALLGMTSGRAGNLDAILKTELGIKNVGLRYEVVAAIDALLA